MGGTWFFATCLFCFLYSSATLSQPVCIVIVIRLNCFSNLFATFWQSVRSVMANHKQP